MLIFVFHPETNGPLAWWINHSSVIYCMVDISKWADDCHITKYGKNSCMRFPGGFGVHSALGCVISSFERPQNKYFISKSDFIKGHPTHPD